MITIILNGSSDKLPETIFMGNFIENNKGLLNQPEYSKFTGVSKG